MNEAYTRMVSECWRGAPYEVCGLLADDAQHPAEPKACKVYPVANVHHDPINFFTMEPTTLLFMWRAIEAAGERVIGYYHSHTQPGDEPAPSEEDLLVVVPQLLSVIVCLRANNITEVGTWVGSVPYGGDLFN